MATWVTYLESRRGSCPADDPICEPLSDSVDKKLSILYRLAFTEKLFSASGSFNPKGEHGALFHLAMIAVHHLSYETGNASSYVVDIENEQLVQLYNRNSVGQVRAFGTPYERHVDIVLSGTRGIRSVDSSNEWVEMKSYQGPAKFYPSFNRYRRWNLGTGKIHVDSNGSRNHRNYFLDRVAAKAHGATPELTTNFQWAYQGFKNRPMNGRANNGYTSADLDQISPKIRALVNNRGVAFGSLSFNRTSENNTLSEQIQNRSRLKIINLKNWILNEVGRRLIQGIGDDLIDEVIRNAANDIS